MDETPSIGEQGRAARQKLRRLKNVVDVADTHAVAQAGGVAYNGDTSLHDSEHYHLCFEVVGETPSTPFFQQSYPTKRAAYLEVKRLGDESEPNTEWGQDGRVQIETPVAGRTGLFRVVVSVAMCVSKKCRRAYRLRKNGLVVPSIRRN